MSVRTASILEAGGTLREGEISSKALNGALVPIASESGS